MSDLKLGFASAAAARHAVENWHYSGTVPPGKAVKVGAWEHGEFIGVVIFSRGASSNIGKPYSLQQTEIVELTRVALNSHEAPVSQVVAGAIKMLRSHSPGLRLIVSYADPHQGHTGGIYQAMNWVYAGRTDPTKGYRVPETGEILHNRMVSPTGYVRQFGRLTRVLRPDQCEVIEMPGKHRYLMPLDKQMRRQIKHLAQPYPKS